jgi:hypothetical protein
MAIKRKRVIQISLLFLVALFIVPRLWLQFRPIPISSVIERPMTQAEWEKFTGSTNTMPMGSMMPDSLPYPAFDKQIYLSFWDVQVIRALASWNSFFPYRSIAISVSSRTNAAIHVYERHTTSLTFTKDESGWHMEREGGQIDWFHGTEPTISFH